MEDGSLAGTPSSWSLIADRGSLKCSHLSVPQRTAPQCAARQSADGIREFQCFCRSNVLARLLSLRTEGGMHVCDAGCGRRGDWTGLDWIGEGAIVAKKSLLHQQPGSQRESRGAKQNKRADAFAAPGCCSLRGGGGPHFFSLTDGLIPPADFPSQPDLLPVHAACPTEPSQQSTHTD